MTPAPRYVAELNEDPNEDATERTVDPSRVTQLFGCRFPEARVDSPGVLAARKTENGARVIFYRETMTTKLLIVDDHALLREAVAFWLSQDEEIKVVGKAENGRLAVDLARHLHPDVVLMDMIMPHMDGAAATSVITHELPGIKVIILSDVASSRHMSDALTAGASGFLLKSCEPKEVLRAIHDVASGGSYLTPAASTAVLNCCLHKGETTSPTWRNGLTSRQRQILHLIAEGRSIKQIGRQLALSPKTIDWHRSQIMKRLGIDTTAGLVRYAIVEGLTVGDPVPMGIA